MKKIRKQINTNKKRLFLIIFSLFAVLISISCASATTVYVNATNGSDTSGNGSAVNPFHTIQKGVDNITDGDSIIIAIGQYNGTGNTNITLNKNMTIKGQSQSGTIINGTDTNWIFHINTGLNVTIQDLTLANGNKSPLGSAIWNYGTCIINDCTFTGNTASAGGAIDNEFANLTVTGSSFIGNTATTGYGGALNIHSSNCTVTGCTFTSNKAPNGYGGAINNEVYSNLTVINSNFTGNNANMGGAIYNWNHCNLTVIDSTFTGNSASTEGGAIYNEGGTSTTFVVISGSNFINNNAPGSAGYGGAIFNTGYLMNENSCTFTGNNATYYGGAIYNGGTLYDIGSTFVNNIVTGSAGDGGAIYNAGHLLSNGDTFTGNNATDAAGAIANFGTLDLAGGIFTNNKVTGSAGDGGAIFNNGALNIENSAFTSNTANAGGAIHNNGGGGNTLNVKSSNFVNNSAAVGGAICNGGSGTNTVDVNFSRFIGNSNDITNFGTNLIDAEYNWWGLNNGPGATKVSGPVNCSNWLIFNITASPTTINTGGTSQIKADLTHDVNGTYHDPASGHVPDGIQVLFSSTLGSISNALTNMGIVVSTLNAGSTPGTAVVSAAVDSQIVSTNVTINQGPNSQWKLVTYTYSVYEPVKKWYKKWYRSHAKWNYYWKSYNVKIWVKQWYISHGKLRYHWKKVTKYKFVYKTGQKWELI